MTSLDWPKITSKNNFVIDSKYCGQKNFVFFTPVVSFQGAGVLVPLPPPPHLSGAL